MDSATDRSADHSVALTFFNDFEARTIEAASERIIPGGDGGAGATNAGVVYYIDRAIAGFSTSLQTVYRLGLRELDVFCRHTYGNPFVQLASDRQDEVVRRFLGPETGDAAATRKPVGEDDYDFDSSADHPGHALDRPRGANDQPLLERLFAVLREHTIEGLLCDPVYGGNRDACGWRLVGFPGAHWGYTAEQMKEGFDGRKLPIVTLSDLRRNLASQPDSSAYNSPERA